MQLKSEHCWEIKGCPASFYINCKAYEQQKSCWEVKDGCLCHVSENCDHCSIYQDFLKLKSSSN